MPNFNQLITGPMKSLPHVAFTALLILTAVNTQAGNGQASVCAAAGVLTIYVVRHAEREIDGSRDPGLSEAGHDRARALGDLLADARLDAVHVTDFRRTIETVAQVLKRTGIEKTVWPVSWQSVADHARSLASEVCEQYRDHSVLVVGHSNTVAPLVRAFSGLEITALSERDYDHFYQIRLHPDRSPELLRLRFGQPSSGQHIVIPPQRAY